MTLLDLQRWLNSKIKELGLNLSLLLEDGKSGPKTKSTFIEVFRNKNSTAISDTDIDLFSKQLGDKDSKRLKAISMVESGGSGWDKDGLMRILYERHYFYKTVQKEITTDKGVISSKTPGGYTIDSDNNGINDSWDKLSEAICIDVDGAIKSVSVGKFQVMCSYYDILGYNTPLDMLWLCSRQESEQYKVLVGFILKVSKIQKQFLNISGNSVDCIPFVRSYNGINWEKNDYANKLSKAYSSL